MRLVEPSKTLNVINDLHLFSPYQLLTPMKFLSEIEPDDTILIGDIVDLYNCRYSELKEAELVIETLRHMFNERYVTGNHELAFQNMYHVEKMSSSNVLFIHGDVIYWDKERWREFRLQRPGSSNVNRFLAKIWNHLRHLKSETISDASYERASNLAMEHDCNIIVTGHQHPLHLIMGEHNKIKIVCLPQGKHTLTVTYDTIFVDVGSHSVSMNI